MNNILLILAQIRGNASVIEYVPSSGFNTKIKYGLHLEDDYSIILHGCRDNCILFAWKTPPGP